MIKNIYTKADVAAMFEELQKEIEENVLDDDPDTLLPFLQARETCVAIIQHKINALIKSESEDWLPQYEGKLVAESEQEPIGHWITVRSTFFDIKMYRCSECKNWSPYKQEKCPNCHARMVEVK